MLTDQLRIRKEVYDPTDGYFVREVKSNDLQVIASLPGTTFAQAAGDLVIAQGVINSAKEGVLTSYGVSSGAIADFVIVINSSTILPTRTSGTAVGNIASVVVATKDAPLATAAASATVSIVAKNAGTGNTYNGWAVIVLNPTPGELETE